MRPRKLDNSPEARVARAIVLQARVAAGLCILVMAAVAGLFVFGFGAAFAADGTTVDLTPSAAIVRELVSWIADAVLGLLAAAVLRWLHLDANAKAAEVAAEARRLLHSAVDNGTTRALGQLGNITSVEVHSRVLASVIDYVQTNAASALRRLKPGDDELEKLIEAEVERQSPGASLYGNTAAGYLARITSPA